MRINIPESDLFMVSDDDENIWLAMDPSEPFEPGNAGECYIVAAGSAEEQIADMRRIVEACHLAIRELGGLA